MHLCAPQNHYLDEFSGLLDELLLKINALSDGLEAPVAEEPRAAGPRAEVPPTMPISGYPSGRVRLSTVTCVCCFLRNFLSSLKLA